MSVHAAGAASQLSQQTGKAQATKPAPAVTPFSQQLDAQANRLGATGGHGHHAGKSQSVTSSVKSLAAVAGPISSGHGASGHGVSGHGVSGHAPSGKAASGSVASSILSLLS